MQPILQSSTHQALQQPGANGFVLPGTERPREDTGITAKKVALAAIAGLSAGATSLLLGADTTTASTTTGIVAGLALQVL